MASKKALALLGPTASGKTSLGIALAQAFEGEIVNLDSVQVYQELNIGSAKPTEDERKAVRHHLLDIACPDENLNSFQLLKRALKAGQEILGRGKLPIFSGGTGLYFKALFYGMFEGPHADWDYRRAFRSRMACDGLASLYEELRLVDPLSAARIAPQDALRIERALEIYHLTGKTKSELEKEQVYDCPFDFV
ncbi:MAG: tRNA (adenosine(37)-N6)-dimethylallyltransferase MiaA, partial [Spirochaetae bacterium HGW-Spirochaetae-6]